MAKYERTVHGIQASVNFLIWKWVEVTSDFEDPVLSQELKRFISQCPPSAAFKKCMAKIGTLVTPPTSIPPNFPSKK